MPEPLSIDNLLLKKAGLNYKALNHPLRQQFLSFIDKQGRVTVTTIYKKLNLEQSVASQHLAILRKAGLVLTEREGRFIFYSVNYQRLAHFHKLAQALSEKKAAEQP